MLSAPGWPMFRTRAEQVSGWEAALPAELLRLPEELARVDALLDDPGLSGTSRTGQLHWPAHRPPGCGWDRNQVMVAGLLRANYEIEHLRPGAMQSWINFSWTPGCQAEK